MVLKTELTFIEVAKYITFLSSILSLFFEQVKTDVNKSVFVIKK
jgi:hypothetical protein